MEFHQLLKDTLGEGWEVYFQAPGVPAMTYPCVVYSLDNIGIDHADDKPYTTRRRYQVQIIDRDPDSVGVDKVAKLPTAYFSRYFQKDGLHHFNFLLHNMKGSTP